MPDPATLPRTGRHQLSQTGRDSSNPNQREELTSAPTGTPSHFARNDRQPLNRENHRQPHPPKTQTSALHRQILTRRKRRASRLLQISAKPLSAPRAPQPRTARRRRLPQVPPTAPFRKFTANSKGHPARKATDNRLNPDFPTTAFSRRTRLTLFQQNLPPLESPSTWKCPWPQPAGSLPTSSLHPLRPASVYNAVWQSSPIGKIQQNPPHSSATQNTVTATPR